MKRGDRRCRDNDDVSTGGANYLQRTYRPRVMMSKEDWDATLRAQRP